MKISNTGYNYRHDSNFEINRPNGSGDYIILLLRTPAVFHISGISYHAKENSFIVYKKGSPQLYGALGEEFANDWVHFDMEKNDEENLISRGIPFDKPIYIGDISSLSQIIKNMCYEKYSANIHKEKSVELYLNLLFIKLSEKINQLDNNELNDYYDKFSELRTKIYNKPALEWTIKEMSKKMMLSESYFQHLYKKIFGISAINDVITSRIEHGKYLLFNTSLSVNAISEECGYKNNVHFIRQFKKNTGLTPTEYRYRFKASKEEIRKAFEKAPFSL